MSTDLFQELFPWYQAALSRMEVVSFKMPESLRELIAKTDLAQDRGEGFFIRTAIAEKLQRLGCGVVDEDWKPASRRGVGGKPTHKAKPAPTGPLAEGETASLAVEESPPYRVSNPPNVAGLSGGTRDVKGLEPSAAEARSLGRIKAAAKARRAKLDRLVRGANLKPDHTKKDLQ